MILISNYTNNKQFIYIKMSGISMPQLTIFFIEVILTFYRNKPYDTNIYFYNDTKH